MRGGAADPASMNVTEGAVHVAAPSNPPRLQKRYWPDGHWEWSVTHAGVRCGYVYRDGRRWLARPVGGAPLGPVATRLEAVGALLVAAEVGS